MILEILPAANEETKRAFLYYESQTAGLGFQFLAVLQEGFGRILSHPRAWAVLLGARFPFHRHLLKQFPYGIIYRQKGNKITVVAVMHLSRKPGYWKNRDKKR